MRETIIDEVREDRDGTVVLVLRQPELWTKPGLLANVQDKLNGYIAAIRDGPLVEKFPDYKGRKFKIRLVCFHDPTKEVRSKIERVSHVLHQLGIGFHVMQINVEQPFKDSTW